MILLTKGLRTPILRALIAFLFLFAGTCTLLLLLTISGVRWPGMAATATSSSDSTLMANAVLSEEAASPTRLSQNLVPIILNSPCVASLTPTTTLTPGLTKKRYTDPDVQQPGYTYLTPTPALAPRHTWFTQNPTPESTPAWSAYGTSEPRATTGRSPSLIRNILEPLLSKLLPKVFISGKQQEGCLSRP